jgi:3-dehydroquinate dehydratase
MHRLLLPTKKDCQRCQKMTSKNPYEVRLDVLKMAQNMLESEQRVKEMKFREKVDTIRKEDGKYTECQILAFIDQNTPTPYSEDEIVTRASSLYNFVSNTTR